MSHSSPASLIAEMMDAIEKDLQVSIASLYVDAYKEMQHMIAHHMGWADPSASRGKRIRPLLTLLCCAGTGSDWRHSVPAASAMELLHNFSLIHDDIQDKSETRRGRPTIWNLWGVAQAINIGDALFTLAHLTMHRTRQVDLPPQTLLDILEIFDDACLELTQGQYLDLTFETRAQVSSEDYMQMITGKTAALLSAASGIGALIGSTQTVLVDAYRQFGYHLGIAFQVLDDLLGIWGNPERTGKPHADDLRSRKKTLPVVYAMEHSPEFTTLWQDSSQDEDHISNLISALEAIGAQEYTRSTAAKHTTLARSTLSAANPTGTAAEALNDLAQQLLTRDR